ncbi:acetyl-CoA carboxylase biotin carboxylase subunit family protein [Kitasatospora sp. NPDC059747]|uniref:ATP-grasp domain-containing protein n=1 Tax=Kitasatospora sp. NPDC059747 TaxID=3346930 RepID=UPI00364F7C67
MHIVVLNRWPRFSDERRWDNELERFEDLDHDRHRISYVVDAEGATGVLADRSHIADFVMLEDLTDLAAVCAAVRAIADRVGPVDQLVALSEYLLDVAAQVREELEIPGPRPAEVSTYRNKLTMKQLLADAGVRVPRFAPCSDVETTTRIARDIGYPLILKPVAGAASKGVNRVADEASLRSWLASVDSADYQIEELIDGTVYHVDGFADHEARVPFQVVSRYINDCLAFETSGAPLGSVVVQESALRERVEEFVRACVAALDMRSMAIHLELFVTKDEEIVFLEIAGRVGGAEVPHLINRLFGVNLSWVWLKAICGEPVSLPAKTSDPSGGWLIIPKRDQLPVKVLHRTSMRSSVPTVWRELVPSPGEVLDPDGSYDAIHSGRYILVGDEAQVEADIQYIIENFRIETSLLPA